MVSPGSSRPGWARRVTAGKLKRLLLAMVAAPVGAWGGGVLAISMMLEAGGVLPPTLQGVGALLGFWLTSLLLSPVFLPLVAPLALAACLPAHLLLAMFGLHHWPAYGLAGAVAGLVVLPAAAQLPGAVGVFAAGYEDPARIGAVAGLGGALAFWAVLRPDRA